MQGSRAREASGDLNAHVVDTVQGLSEIVACGRVATWGEALPGTQESCPLALLSATAYGYKNGQWEPIGSKSAGGVWTPSFDGGFCRINVSFPQASSGYSKVRVATKAAAFVLFASQPRRVSASISLPAAPPR